MIIMITGRRRICCLLISTLQIMNWVSASSRSLASNHDHGALQQVNDSCSDSSPVKFSSKQDLKGIEEEPEVKEIYQEEKKIGSRPPNCENKCYGCRPCEAIQSPTITGHFSLQYANYFPEGWKCKCGPSLYSP